ncbi:MAG: PKD domain-containing protein, partial [Crocinitomicaceae bacterium]|nr:PKD domain-containing protein [Crocinitomicaceae bacterium]
MKKITLALSVICCLFFAAYSQDDIRVNAIISPTSGCALTAFETVTVEIENVGPTDLSLTAFNLEYTINGGPPVNEAVGPLGAGIFTSNTTYTYTFATTANLAVAGSYVFTATSVLGSDVNPTNDFVLGYNVTNDAPSVGGGIAGSATVCSSANAGVLTLSGENGSILRWESSTDGGTTWGILANTTNTQNYSNLSTTTIYRAVVQNGLCAAVNSATATVTVDQAPLGGTVTTGIEVCELVNSGTLTLTGESGTILNWEFSTDGGATWTLIANVTNSQAFLNLAVTTWYRAVIANGVCADANSTIGVVTVNPLPVPSYTIPDACLGAVSSFTNTSTIPSGTIASYSWDFGDGNSSVVTNPTHTYASAAAHPASLTAVSDKGCTDIVFISAIVNTLPDPTITPTGPTTFCAGGSVDLSGVGGLNYVWSTTEITQVITVTTSNTYTLTVTDPVTLCVNSDAITVTVDPLSVGGSVAGSATVCSSGNAGVLTLGGETGSVTQWEFSIDGGATWIAIANTTTTQNYFNLSETTMYRAIVQSGSCASAISLTATVTVDQEAIGGTVSTDIEVCDIYNGGDLLLSGEVGSVLNWESSTDNGATWTPIANVTTTLTFTNLTVTTWYRAVVSNGVCASVNSSIGVVTVHPKPVALYTVPNVCIGQTSSFTNASTISSGNIQFYQWDFGDNT